MANYVEFKGLRHYPIGEAELSLENNHLNVANFGDDGLDGYLVKLNETTKINTLLAPYDFGEQTRQTFQAKATSESVGVFTAAEISFRKEGEQIFLSGADLGNYENIVAKAYLKWQSCSRMESYSGKFCELATCLVGSGVCGYTCNTLL